MRRWSLGGCVLILCVGAFGLGSQAHEHCESAVGGCILTGVYDYGDAQEIDINASPRGGAFEFTTLVHFPSGVKRRQSWSLAKQSGSCELSLTCSNGATLSCYAPAPCGMGQSADTIWCGTFTEDGAYGPSAGDGLNAQIHACKPLDPADPSEPDDPEGGDGDGDEPGDGGTGGDGGPSDDGEPGDEPDGLPRGRSLEELLASDGERPPLSCEYATFHERNVQNPNPWIMKMEDRTTSRRPGSALGPGGHPSFTTVVTDYFQVDVVNEVRAENVELRHFRMKNSGKKLLTQLERIGWVEVPRHFAAKMSLAPDDYSPARFVRGLEGWESQYIAYEPCPRHASKNEALLGEGAFHCYVFRGGSAGAPALYYVRPKDCRLQHVATRNENGPVIVEIEWLEEASLYIEPIETPDRVMTGDPVKDRDIFEALAAGRGVRGPDYAEYAHHEGWVLTP